MQRDILMYVLINSSNSINTNGDDLEMKVVKSTSVFFS